MTSFRPCKAINELKLMLDRADTAVTKVHEQRRRRHIDAKARLGIRTVVVLRDKKAPLKWHGSVDRSLTARRTLCVVAIVQADIVEQFLVDGSREAGGPRAAIDNRRLNMFGAGSNGTWRICKTKENVEPLT